MLANNLTLDDEDAVQNELLALQEDIVRSTDSKVTIYHSSILQEKAANPDITLPSVPEEQPVHIVVEGQYYCRKHGPIV